MSARTKCLESTLLRGICAGVILAVPAGAFAEESAEDTLSKAPRPPPLEALEPAELPVSRHVDVGLAMALVERLTEGQTNAGSVNFRYPAMIGVGLSARVDVWKYLRANLYVVRSSTSTDLAAGMLGLPGDPGLVPLTSYALGLRLSPTLRLGPRARTWLSVGAGWGRMEMGRFDVQSRGSSCDPDIQPPNCYVVRERSFSFLEFPMGFGTSFDIIKNWLAIEFEATMAFHTAQRGTARNVGQTIDTEGKRTVVGPFPEISATFVQTIGLALVL